MARPRFSRLAEGEPVDILDRISLGQSALLGGLDPSQRHLPYYNCGFNNGDVTRFCHCSPADLHHNVARAILAFSMTERITGNPIEKAVFDDLTESLFSLFDDTDDLPGTPTSSTDGRSISLHDIREVTNALSALIERGDERAVFWARRMVRKLRQSLDEKGQIRLQRLPEYVTSYTSQPHQEGRSIGALVNYYRITGDEVALETAVLMTNYALEHCFTAYGALTEKAGHHTHSINGLVAGMLDLAILTNDQQMMGRVKLVYDVGLSSFNSSFGWARERVDELNQKGEGNSSGDYLRGALLLGQAGFSDYFGRAERILRGHLLPSQVIDVESFSDDPHAEEDRMRYVASRTRGGFGFRSPNDLIVEDYINPYMDYETYPLGSQEHFVRSTTNAVLIQEADLLSCGEYDRVITIYDVTSAVIEALCAAWDAVITEDDSGIRINLLLSCEAKRLAVKSHLSGEGRLEIENASGRNVLVRIPQWLSLTDIELNIEGMSHPPKSIGGYLLVPGNEGRKTTEVRFPMHKERTVESISFEEYTIDWVGDQIVAMSPMAKNLPMFPPCK